MLFWWEPTRSTTPPEPSNSTTHRDLPFPILCLPVIPWLDETNTTPELTPSHQNAGKLELTPRSQHINLFIWCTWQVWRRHFRNYIIRNKDRYSSASQTTICSFKDSANSGLLKDYSRTKENMMRSLEMVSGSLLIDQRINMYWKQRGLSRENAILTATSRGTRLAGLLGALSNVKGLTILKPLLPQTNKALFAMTAKKQLHFHHVDMITAFLNSRLGEKVYIEQPLHFHNGNKS